jgi:hypothetical protein
MENFVIKGDVIDYIDGIPVVDDESIRKATSKDSVKMVYRKVILFIIHFNRNQVKMPKRGTDEKSLRTLFVHAIASIHDFHKISIYIRNQIKE